MKEHYFIVKATVEGTEISDFEIVNDMNLDTSRPIWNEENGSWERVAGANERIDTLLINRLTQLLSPPEILGGEVVDTPNNP
jgi:hypothetical protein